MSWRRTATIALLAASPLLVGLPSCSSDEVALVDAGVTVTGIGHQSDASFGVLDGATEAGGDGGIRSTRSALYPTTWKPGDCDAQGRCLPDFSYAGYRNGEPLPAAPYAGMVVSVVDKGANPGGTTDSRLAFQAAIQAVSANPTGGTVYVPKGLYRIDGTLKVTASRVHILGDGAAQSKMYFTSVPAPGTKHLAFEGAVTRGADVFLAADTVKGSALVHVADAGAITVGDDVGIGIVITPEFIADHGMTGTWVAFNGTWQAFFRRTVRRIDRSTTPQTIELDVPLRYGLKMRDRVSLRKESGYLTDVSVSGVALSNVVAWSSAFTVDRVHVLGMSGVKDSWVNKLESFASPLAQGQAAGMHLQSGGVYVGGSKRVTVSEVSLANAENRGEGGSGYMFEILQSSEILTVDAKSENGRHNFIQNWAFDTSGCVWLRCTSRGGLAMTDGFQLPGVGLPATSEFHHSLAMSNLIDSCTLDDGWHAENRGSYSTGAGIASTDAVFWNNVGKGEIRSKQYGNGYVIGTASSLRVDVKDTEFAPEDYTELLGKGETLSPSSLYEDQRRRRVSP